VRSLGFAGFDCLVSKAITQVEKNVAETRTAIKLFETEETNLHAFENTTFSYKRDTTDQSKTAQTLAHEVVQRAANGNSGFPSIKPPEA
jgi:hypothetical protein